MNQAYLEAHSSPFFQKLKNHFKKEKFSTFEFIGESCLDFVFKQQNLAVKILDDSHDHTDSYFVEAKLQADVLASGLTLVFVEEDLGLAQAIEKIEQCLRKKKQ